MLSALLQSLIDAWWQSPLGEMIRPFNIDHEVTP